MIFSHSRLSNFERCPRRFQYRYLLGIPPEGESIESYLGKRVHEVLERLYHATAKGFVPTLAQVRMRFRQLWNDGFDAARVRFARPELDTPFYLAQGDRCLENYYRAHYPFDGDETLGVEERVEFELGPDAQPVRFQGVVDRIARARDGAIEIHDFKTGARVPSQEDLDTDRQLALYQIGLARTRPLPGPVRLVWHYLRQGIVRVSQRDPQQLLELESETLGLVERIAREREYAPVPGRLCAWCEYRDGCPASPHYRAELPGYGVSLPPPAIARSARRRPVVSSAQLSLPFA
ncbi:MAG TPA: PD-(D/E)XK nuclease family protein [Myxococcota bacterium]|nr:PD-(D/E)XK nuclease family protein [Myxococcota bacterium]